MALDTFTIKTKVAITLDANTQTNVVPLFTYTSFTKAGYRVVNEYFEVKNLKAVAFIYNIATVPFPVFDLEDSESKQLLDAINLEWKSPRIEMDILLTTNNGTNWQRIAAYSLLNPNPYPYREYSLGDHALGSNAMVGIQMKNVGFGLLQNGAFGSDKITVFADLERVVTVERISDTSSRIANTITTTASKIVNSNNNRTGISFQNNSLVDVFVDTVNTVKTSSYAVKLAPGDYYEALAPIYTGSYYAVIASGTASIEIREYV
ncbi:hypothetical protein [Nostoc sp. TCL240-02]|uniref:hypothetical protein n=1 Tax=Nostoc sp. TCL240-02 TaxID=2572090 RepID=UPI00157FB8A1|nr:hypothetical protein [Nostoc sp. TCL240-02]QKQ76455.1 hypothetical protein FBB35_27005 [Nostoc sp. TCL240-02]